MRCELCAALKRQYERREYAYAAALGELRAAERANTAGLAAVRAIAQSAQADSEAALLRLNEHKRLHALEG
jgi:hypothetical protein